MPAIPEHPELLAPAGGWDCLRAAVANGADAVYFGLPRFNARLRADNFRDEELAGVVTFCHRHGVKAYVAFNTLVFTGELDAAEAMLRDCNRAGVDALIVQDVGLVRLARAVTPELAIHASTQMTITSPEGVEFARDLGIERVVLARELSLGELEKFRTHRTDAAAEKSEILNPKSEMPLEVFVHGALCVAYSGQCLTSESLGQRSANRGECAQACRMPYELIVDGEVRDLGDKRYLLSPQDLAAVKEIPALIERGVMSFKIEGRLKSPEYVAAVCQVYRKAIDAAISVAATPSSQHVPAAPSPQCSSVVATHSSQCSATTRKVGDFPATRRGAAATHCGEGAAATDRDGGVAATDRDGGVAATDCGEGVAATDRDGGVAAADRYQLEMTFSRGLFTGWMHGVDHQRLVSARFGKKRGPFAGRVARVGHDHVEFEAEVELKPGDGVVFDTGGDTNAEQGGRIYQIKGRRYFFEHGRIDFALLKPGDRVWKTDDPALNKRLQQSFAGRIEPRHRTPVVLVVRGRAGEPMEVECGFAGWNGPQGRCLMRPASDASAANAAAPVSGKASGLASRDVSGGSPETTGGSPVPPGALVVCSTIPLQAARTAPLSNEKLREHLGRFGGHPYALAELRNELTGEVILPIGELNRIRRELAFALDAALAHRRTESTRTWREVFAQPVGLSGVTSEGDFSRGMNLPNRGHPERSEGSLATGTQSKDPVDFTNDAPPQFDGILRLRAAPPSPPRRSAQDDPVVERFIPPQKSGPCVTPLTMTERGHAFLSVLCRTMEQIEAALDCGVAMLCVDFEDIRRYKDAVALVRAHRVRRRGEGAADTFCDEVSQPRILLATPRIQKAGEQGFFKLIENAAPDGVLIRNLGAIDYFRGNAALRCVGDFSLNVANPIAAQHFIAKGLERVTISYDLNIAQVLDLLAAAAPAWFELTLHQHMPMFHMEHCVFAAFMSKGSSFLDCGRPCDRHRVHLRDRVGVAHPLRADVGCRNTLFNAVPQTGARFFDALMAAGLRAYRVELLEEDGAETRRVVRAYQELLAGRRDGDALWRELKAQSQIGVTKGTLETR